jgi:hypothetical protein
MLMIDVDEFLVTPPNTKIPSILDTIPYSIGGVRIGRYIGTLYSIVGIVYSMYIYLIQRYKDTHHTRHDPI